MSRLTAILSGWTTTLILVIAALLVAIWLWNRYATGPWTRDGHVRVDVVRVTTDIGGLVTQVEVQDNQPVRSGQLLFAIDGRRYALALKQADAAAEGAQATFDLARKLTKQDLVSGDRATVARHEQNLARVHTARAALDQALAARDIAALNLSSTEVRAPTNGVVTNLDLRPGDYLSVGAQALALVDTDSLRVEGYFEETKLRQITAGDAVRMRLMGDPRVLFGHVESIAAAIADDQSVNTGNLLPAVAPTFSWVTLAERIPVRIHIDRKPADLILIAGRTVIITVVPSQRDTANEPVSSRPVATGDAMRLARRQEAGLSPVTLRNTLDR